jgi:type I restriction enzyme S subunit
MEKQLKSPKLRFPEFTDEWKKKKLGEISDLITKGTTPSKFVNEGIKFIKIECFDGDKINSEKCLFIDEKTHNKELKRSILQENDLLFAIAGATIGKVNFVRKEILPANTNQALAIVRLKKQENRNYIYQILKSNRMLKYITDSISVGAQPNLNLEQMNNFSFFYPTLPEQKRIASFFTALDKKITELKQKKNLLEQYKKGVMKKLFSQDLRFKDVNGKEFPKCEKKKLSEICDNINDILFGMIGTIGNPVLVKSDGFAIKNVALIKEKKELLNLFLIHFLKGDAINKQFFEQNTGGTQKFLSLSIVRNLVIEIPSIQEQTKIANFLFAIDEKTNRTVNQIQQTQQYKKGLLQNMFV